VKTTYKIELFYSKEDEGFIAVAPDLPGCSAFGETPEEALKEIEIAQSLWLKTAEDIGKDIPEPIYPYGPLAGDHPKREMRSIRAVKTREQSVFDPPGRAFPHKPCGPTFEFP
jgi:predicted RNase H-like HicB family nuclease